MSDKLTYQFFRHLFQCTPLPASALTLITIPKLVQDSPILRIEEGNGNSLFGQILQKMDPIHLQSRVEFNAGRQLKLRGSQIPVT